MTASCVLILRRSLLLLLLLIRADFIVGSSNDHEGTSGEWLGLIRYLLAAVFVVFGLHVLLYSHLETYSLMKRYRDHSIQVAGDVLSCDPSPTNRKKYQAAILYTAPVHKFATDPRQRFRYLNPVEQKRFLRRVETDQLLPRGTIVEVLLLKGEPRSGCTRELVEQNIQNHSHLRTVLFLVPGLTLLALILWLAVQQVLTMEDSRTGWIVLGVSLVVIMFVSRAVCETRFDQEKNKRFNSAVAMKTKTQATTPVTVLAENAFQKSEPLLASDGLPIVFGKDVV